MPVVMINIDATNATGPGVAAAVTSLESVSKALDKMAVTATAAEAAISKVGSSAGAQAVGVERLMGATRGLNSSLRGSTRAVDQWIGAMQALDRSSNSGMKGFDALVAGTYRVNAALGDSLLVLDAYITKLGELDAAAIATGRTLGMMRGAGSLGSLTRGGGGGGSANAGGYFGTGMASFGGTSVYGNGALQTNAGGFGVRAGAGMLGAVPMPLLIAGVIAAVGGVKAVTTANQYNQSIADIVSQSTQNPNMVAPLQKGVLDLAGGSNRFTPQQLVTGLYPIASSPIFNTVAKQQDALSVVSLQAQGSGAGSIKSLASADVAAVSAFHMSADKMSYVADVIAKGVNIGLAESPAFASGVGTFSQAALAADPNRNRAFEQSIGAFAQQTNLSPKFRFDAQGENAFLLNVNKGLTKAGTQVADSLGISNMFGAGAIGKAGGLQAWFKQFEAATAGPNQQNYEQNLGLRQNALQFLRGFTGGNYATGQIAIGATAYSTAKGTVQKGADIADKGPLAEWNQVQSRFNKDIIELGTVISDKVTPALTKMAAAALSFSEGVAHDLGLIGNWLDKVAPYVTKDRPQGQGYDIPVVGGLFQANDWGLHQQGQLGNWMGNLFGGGSTHAAPLPSTPTPHGATPGSPAFNTALHAIQQPGFAQNLLHNLTATAPQRQWEHDRGITRAAETNAFRFGGVDYSDGGRNYGDLNAARQRGTDALIASRGTPSSSANQDVRNDRGALSNLEQSGTATSAQLHAALAKLAAALDRSVYSAGQKENIWNKESGKVNTFDRALQAQGFQDMANAAQDNLQAAQQMGKSPEALKKIFDAFIADERAVIMLTTKPGVARDKALGALTKQQNAGDYVYDVGTLNRGLKDRQDQAAIDKLNGNMGAYSADLKAIYAYQAANAQKFGMNGKDLALAYATMQHDIGAGQPKTNLHPFYQANQGVGGLMAGINSTAVRVGGHTDPATSAIRELMKENARLQHENTNLLQEIANNTRMTRPTANQPASAIGQRNGRN